MEVDIHLVLQEIMVVEIIVVDMIVVVKENVLYAMEQEIVTNVQDEVNADLEVMDN